MLVRLPPVLFSLSSLSVSSVKLRILENFTLYLRNSWSLNLRAIENCICGLRSIGRKMRFILRTVYCPAIWIWGRDYRLIRSGILNGSSDKLFCKNFYDTISREEHKTIYSSPRIAGMALSNQSELPAFSSPPASQSATTFFPAQQFRKMTCRDWPYPWRWLTQNGQIPEDDLPSMAKFRLLTSRNWPGPITSVTVICCYQQSQFANSQKRIWWNQQPKRKKNLPGLQFIPVDRMSLVSPPCSNGRQHLFGVNREWYSPYAESMRNRISLRRRQHGMTISLCCVKAKWDSPLYAESMPNGGIDF